MHLPFAFVLPARSSSVPKHGTLLRLQLTSRSTVLALPKPTYQLSMQLLLPPFALPRHRPQHKPAVHPKGQPSAVSSDRPPTASLTKVEL